MARSDAETVVRLLSKNRELFVDVMMVEELGLLPSYDSFSHNVLHAVVCSLSYILFGVSIFLPFLRSTIELANTFYFFLLFTLGLIYVTIISILSIFIL